MQNFDAAKYRKKWRAQWLESLACLSNLNLQNRWIDKKITNPAWTYIEFKENYFDDLCLSDGYEKKIQETFVTQ